ncbi:spermidine synthase [Lacisediminihabitans sp. H27-G8]
MPMSLRFEELDFQPTPMGDLSLRRRIEPTLGVDVFEVKLGEEFLMSSLFTVAEEELATLGLAAVEAPTDLDVLVGGLGLGYTAVAALADSRVRTVTVIDTLPAVIDWHRRGLLPVSVTLTDDPRTSLLHDDFFALMRREPDGSRYDAILLDVDHSPRHQLDPSHADLYTVDGMRALVRHLKPEGIFALWSDDPPDEEFLARASVVFGDVVAHVVDFDNPLTSGVSSNTVYVATQR